MDHPAPPAVGFTHLRGGTPCLSARTPPTMHGKSRNSIGSRPRPTPTGQRAWRDTSRSSGACSNACGRTAKNRAATRRTSLAPPAILGIDLRLDALRQGTFARSELARPALFLRVLIIETGP